jgi:hypothetical protein
MLATMAGPQGVALRGRVVDLPDEQAKQVIATGSARPFNKEQDAKKPVGMTRAKDAEE